MSNTTFTAIITATGTANQIIISAGENITVAIANNPILPGTAGFTAPSGTTAQRAGGPGTIRYNSTTSLTEITNDGIAWSPLNTAATSVDTVNGTAGRITSTGGTNPIIDIDAAYVGQASITTLGTITTGTWQATPVALLYGGTNAALVASNGGLIYSTATAMAVLATANNGTLITSAGGIPSISSTLPNAVQDNITRLGTIASIGTPLGGTFGGTGVNNGASTLTLAGNLSTVGAFAAVFNFTAGTNVTFPTTGTLSTTTGTVTSVSGTANRITSTGGATPVIDIDAAYVGQTSITTLGTIGTGTWAGTNVALNHGGTNAALVASNGGIFYSTATAGAILAGTATATQMLQSGASAAPAWSTTTWPATSTINQLLYSSAANVISGLATANSGTLVTSSTGVPSLLALGATQVLVGVSGATPAAGSIPGKNMVFNGNFLVWQRGAGGAASFAVPASTTQYTADRWQIITNATQASTIVQAAGATSGAFLAKIQRNSGQTGTATILFGTSLLRDMCIGTAGSVITLSFKALAGANYSATANALGVVVYSGTGTSDKAGINNAYTGSALAINQTATLSTTLTNFSFTSAALGATVTQLAVQFNFTPTGTAGVDDSFSVTDVQLELSPVQTPYERLSFGEELRRDKRFYQKTFDYASAPVQNVASNVGALFAIGQLVNVSFGVNWIFDGLMRTNAPSITTFSPNAGSANWSTNGTTPTAVVTQAGGSNVALSGTTSVTAGNGYFLHATAENDVT